MAKEVNLNLPGSQRKMTESFKKKLLTLPLSKRDTFFVTWQQGQRFSVCGKKLLCKSNVGVMLNAVKHLAGGKAGFSTLEQILPCGQNDSRSGFGMVTFCKPRIAGCSLYKRAPVVYDGLYATPPNLSGSSYRLFADHRFAYSSGDCLGHAMKGQGYYEIIKDTLHFHYETAPPASNEVVLQKVAARLDSIQVDAPEPGAGDPHFGR